MTPDFLIIGAGLAGLSAHHMLLQKGYSVVTLEASTLPGGRVRTEKLGGGFSDTGAQFFTYGYPRIMSLLNELRIPMEKASPFMGHKGKNSDLVVNSANPLSPLTSGFLSLKSCVLLASHMAFLGGKRNPEAPETLADLEGDALSYCRKYFNDEIIEKIFIPYFSAFNYAAPEELSSALVVRALLHIRSGDSLMGIPGGLATLPKKLSEGKDIRYGVRVNSVSESTVHTESGEFSAGKIIVATTATMASRILGTEFPEYLQTNYASSVHEGILLKSRRDDPAYGTLVSPERNPDINVITQERKKASGLTPDQSELIGVLRSSAGAKKEKADGLYELLGINESEILERKKTVWSEAIPVLAPGQFQKIARYRKSVSSESSVFLAGDYLSTGCAEGAVESGQFVAGLFASRL